MGSEGRYVARPCKAVRPQSPLAIWVIPGVLAGWLMACAGGGGTQGDTDTSTGVQSGGERYVDGEPCIDAGSSECDGPGVLWQCDERSWSRVDCEEVCAPRGGLLGCLTLKEESAVCRCRESPAAHACAPEGNKECVSAEEVAVCEMQSENELQWTVQSCEDWCSALDPPLLSKGCGQDACECTWEGTQCDEKVDVPSCWLEKNVARCSGGIWVLEKCWMICGSGSLCDPFAEGGPACDCEE